MLLIERVKNFAASAESDLRKEEAMVLALLANGGLETKKRMQTFEIKSMEFEYLVQMLIDTEKEQLLGYTGVSYMKRIVEVSNHGKDGG